MKSTGDSIRDPTSSPNVGGHVYSLFKGSLNHVNRVERCRCSGRWSLGLHATGRSHEPRRLLQVTPWWSLVRGPNNHKNSSGWFQMGVEPKIGGKPPKWMVKIMENPIKMDDLVVFPYFWKPQIFFIFTPILGEMIHFGLYFSDGLKPPTTKKLVVFLWSLVFDRWWWSKETFFGVEIVSNYQLYYFEGGINIFYHIEYRLGSAKTVGNSSIWTFLESAVKQFLGSDPRYRDLFSLLKGYEAHHCP